MRLIPSQSAFNGSISPFFLSVQRDVGGAGGGRGAGQDSTRRAPSTVVFCFLQRLVQEPRARICLEVLMCRGIRADGCN